MNLLLRELKANYKVFLLWCLGLSLFLGVMAMKLTGMTGEAGGSEFEALFAQMPRTLRNLFGIGVVDFSKTIGIFAMVNTYISLVLAFHATGVGTSAFAREERDRTFEFLYVKGMARGKILAVKLFVSLLQIVLLNAVSYAVSIIVVKSVMHEDMAADYLPITIGMLLLQLTFFSMGFLISFLTRQQKKAGSISFAIVMICFIFTLFSDISDKLEFLKYFTPFKYFDGKLILTEGFNPVYIVVCLLFSAACIALSFTLHQKRDLRT